MVPDSGTGINATIRTFGYPDSLVAAYEHWVVLLRPQQTTLGALILAARGDATAFSALAPGAFTELSKVTRDIEATLKARFQYDKINYLMLMMVDPNVHFHVLPRYGSPREFEGISFEDSGWPKVPNLGAFTQMSDPARNALLQSLRAAWPAS